MPSANRAHVSPTELARTEPASVAPSALGDERWQPRTVVYTALGLAAAALIVRVLARPGRPMWFDECVSVALARAPLRQLLPQLAGGEANGGLHTLLLAGLLRITDPLGVDALLVGRGFSIAVGSLAVAALFILGHRLLGDRPALVAAGLLAVSRFHVNYSVESRSYALALLLVVLSTLALDALLESPRAAPALVFGLLAALATWAHLFAALVLAAQVLATPRHRGFRHALGWLLVGLAVGGGGSAAVVAVVMRGDAGQVSWIGPLTWSQVASLFVELSGGARLVLVPALVGVVVAGAAALRGGARSFGAAMALSWAVIPIALAVVVSVVKPLLVPRYLLVSLPGFVLLVALGIGELRRPRSATLAAILVALLATREMVRGGGEPRWQPVDQVAARVLELARPGDVVVVSHPALSVSIDRELTRLGRAPGPERVEPVPGDPLSLGASTRPGLAERLERRSGFIFVLLFEQPDSAATRAALASDTRVTGDEYLGGIRVQRMERLTK
jgi:hypothetical protein